MSARRQAAAGSGGRNRGRDRSPSDSQTVCFPSGRCFASAEKSGSRSESDPYLGFDRRGAAVLTILLGIFCVVTPSRAQEPAPPATATILYDEGLRALNEGLPSVAAFKLRAFLHLDLDPVQRRAAALALVRVLLAVPDAAAAQAALDANLHPPAADAAPDPELAFWRGQTQAALGHWPDALAGYTQAAQVDSPLRAQAILGQGECLFVLNRAPEAAGVLAPLCDHPRLGAAARLRCAEIALGQGKLEEAALRLRASQPVDPAEKERSYLLGRLRLAQGQPGQAEIIFSTALAQPEGLSERLVVDLSWGRAQARLDQGRLDTAQDALEELIDHYPRSIFLPRTFAWLETLYLQDPRPDLSELRRWAGDGSETNRQTLALLTLGRAELHVGDTDHAEMMFRALVDGFPTHPLHARALVDLAALELRLGRPAEARATLNQARPQVAELVSRGPPPGLSDIPDAAPRPPASARPTSPSAWRTELDVLDARISLAENDHVKAAAGFAAVASRLKEGPQAEAAAFDAVLCWLRAVDTARYPAAEEDFRARFPASPLAAEFALEEGLARARQAGPGDRLACLQASACLQGFLREQPAHARAPEARLALAELAFERPEPNLAAARRELDAPALRLVANDLPPKTDPERERAEDLAIWLADAPGPARDEDKAILLARRFLTDHPASPLAPEVRMKLGEIYFQRADYPDAQTQLELLAESAPNSPLAESAQYLAGLAAAASMSPAGLDKAVTLFEASARRDGPLRLAARLRQAEVQSQLEQHRDAISLYDSVLKATGDVTHLSDTDLDARCAALGGRGRALLALAAADPKLYPEAVAAFDQLRNTPGASLLWQRQALTQKGQALEKMGEPDAALAAYDDALNAPAATDGTPDAPEWTWFYRAGNDAARLLEARSQWTAAIAIYKKLAAADGPMKSEFENQLNRSRLEHFVWEE